MAFFSFKMYLYRIFLARIRNQHLRIDPCAKFQLHWTRNKGTRILTGNNTKNDSMTSYLPPSDEVSKIFMAFESQILSQNTIMPSFIAIRPQIKEKQKKKEKKTRNSLMVPKDPSLNRVEL